MVMLNFDVGRGGEGGRAEGYLILFLIAKKLERMVILLEMR